MERLLYGSRKWAKTIAVVEPPPRLSNAGVMPGGEGIDTMPGGAVSQDSFKIRLAHDDARTREARFLVEKRYRDAGYSTHGGPHREICPERITLATYKSEEVVGTLTIGFDTGHGLLADELYRPEIDALRARGRKVCEFTKFAFDVKKATKRVLGGLFHVAYLYAGKIWCCNDVVIEVNPSHANFYKRMLGFTELAGERFCPRVGAPAVLLHLDAAHAHRMAQTYGGQAGAAAHTERSLYPYFMSPEEGQALLVRMARG